ncbi:calmodulin-related protein 97a-like [Anaeramoeba ignava]|uniref:Calmodulin-related protein 97a-like n=1 Tax=Anaeramoeba ignava TaxID=1746090 RepID=A0A9Q0LJ99_ANAIG|nr:calmodulin-related protein 97a-like [Anaeramoeba ignava]
MEEKEIRQAFDKVDLDRNNIINKKEFIEFCKLINIKEEKIKEIFSEEKNIKNDDSYRYEDIKVLFVEEDSVIKEEDILESFKTLDKDGKGSIAREDLTRLGDFFGQVTDEDIDLLFQAYDKNMTGRLEYDEFKELMLRTSELK